MREREHLIPLTLTLTLILTLTLTLTPTQLHEPTANRHGHAEDELHPRLDHPVEAAHHEPHGRRERLGVPRLQRLGARLQC